MPEVPTEYNVLLIDTHIKHFNKSTVTQVMWILGNTILNFFKHYTFLINHRFEIMTLVINESANTRVQADSSFSADIKLGTNNQH